MSNKDKWRRRILAFGAVPVASLAFILIYNPSREQVENVVNEFSGVRQAEPRLEAGVSDDYIRRLKKEQGYPVQGVESMVDSEARVAGEPIVETKPKQIEPETNYELSIRKNPSPDYTPGRKNKIDIIVLHTTGGSGTGAEDWLTRKDNVPASAHYLIMEDGELVRLVDEKDTAWHCRGYNDRSIGIEFAGYHDKPLNESQIRGGQQLIKSLMLEYGISRENIRAHSELDPSRRKDPGKANMEAILSGIN